MSIEGEAAVKSDEDEEDTDGCMSGMEHLMTT